MPAWTRRALFAASLVLCSCAAPAVATPVASPAGIVTLTADGVAIDTTASSMPTTLDLGIVAERPLVPADTTVSLDGSSGAVTVSASADGALRAVSHSLALGSTHTLRVVVAGETVYSDQIQVIGITGVMAAVHTENGAPVADVVFENDVAPSVLTGPAGAGAAVSWSDPQHARIQWSTPPDQLTLPASLSVLHGSRLAGAVVLQILPTPAAGTLRRVTVPAVIAAQLPLTAYSVSTDASAASVVANIGHISVAAPAGMTLNGDGSITGAPAAGVVAAARAGGVTLLPLVQNDSSNGTATQHVLESTTARAAAVIAITAAADAPGVGGITLDMEGVSASDSSQLTALISAIATALHAQHKRLDVDIVPHKPDHLNIYSAAYDVPAIAAAADHIVVMAYDEHTEPGDPGPVDGLDWTQQLLSGTLPGVPPSKVILGLALYARTWRGNDVEASSYASALSKALTTPGARVDYDFISATPSITYTPPGTAGPAVVWFDDAQTVAAKTALADGQGFAGIAVWRLGFEDPALWATLRG